MKILFINPNVLVHKDYQMKETGVPLGILYMASVLMEHGHEVLLVDCLSEDRNNRRFFADIFDEVGLDDDDIIKRIDAFSPDLIALSCMFTFRFPLVLRIAKKIKDRDPTIPIIVGGVLVTGLPQLFLKNEYFDYVMMGEGERTMLEFVNAIERKAPESDLKNIPGLGFCNNGSTYLNDKFDRVENLDSLPLPARHLIDNFQVYLDFGRNSVITARGCALNCIFCCLHLVAGRKMRFRNPKLVVDELEFIQKTYNHDFMVLENDNFTLNKKHAHGVLDEMIKRNLGINWTCVNGVSVNSLDYDLLKKMRKAGCHSIFTAVESADYDVLKAMRKQVDLDKVIELRKWTQELGMFLRGFFLFGVPGDNMAAMEKTLDFAIKVGFDSIASSIVSPHPGTEIYNWCIEKGYIDPDNIDFTKMNHFEPNFPIPGITMEEIKSFQQYFNKRFVESRGEGYDFDEMIEVMKWPTIESLDEMRMKTFGFKDI